MLWLPKLFSNRFNGAGSAASWSVRTYPWVLYSSLRRSVEQQPGKRRRFHDRQTHSSRQAAHKWACYHYRALKRENKVLNAFLICSPPSRRFCNKLIAETETQFAVVSPGVLASYAAVDLFIPTRHKQVFLTSAKRNYDIKLNIYVSRG